MESKPHTAEIINTVSSVWIVMASYKESVPSQGKDVQQVWQAEPFARMCLTGQKTAPTGHSKPKRRAPNRSAQVNTVSTTLAQDEQESSSDDEYIYTLGHKPGKMQVPETNVEINGIKMKIMIDTGASTDIIDETAF